MLTFCSLPYVGGWEEDGWWSEIVRKGDGHTYFIAHFNQILIMKVAIALSAK